MNMRRFGCRTDARMLTCDRRANKRHCRLQALQPSVGVMCGNVSRCRLGLVELSEGHRRATKMLSDGASLASPAHLAFQRAHDGVPAGLRRVSRLAAAHRRGQAAQAGQHLGTGHRMRSAAGCMLHLDYHVLGNACSLRLCRQQL